MSAIAMAVAGVPAPSEAGEAIEIRVACAADNAGLLELARATPMAGTISLRIDREPDFFALLRLRGDAVVYVAICNERVVGCISGTVYDGYVCGAVERIVHIGDLKVHPLFTGRRLSVRLMDALQAHMQALGIDLTFNLVAKGNSRVMPFCDGRYGTRAVTPVGEFIVEEILPSPFRARSRRYAIAEAKREDLPELAGMVDAVRRRREFARVVPMADLDRALSSAGSSNVLVARDAGRIVATLTVEEVQGVKRNVLMGAPAALRMGLGVLRVAAMVLPKMHIPRVGDELRMLYVRYMGCIDGHEGAFVPLLAAARAAAFSDRFTFLSVGLHEKDPFRAAVAGLPRFTFHSLAMGNSLLTADRVRGLDLGVPYEDFALV